MLTNEGCFYAAGSRTRRLLITAVLAAMATFASLNATAQAQECTTPSDCVTFAQWQNAAADDFSNKAAWFRETSRQNFVNAKQWYDRANFAFHAGEAEYALAAKNTADYYSKSAVADAKAADNYAAQATFTRAAAGESLRRGLFIAGGEKSAADYPSDPGNVDGDCQNSDELCLLGVHKSCKRHPLDTYWHPRIAGGDVYRAHVYTMWCFQNGRIVSRHTETGDHHITDWGHAWSYTIDNGPDLKRTYCNPAKTACFTRYQYGIRGGAVHSGGGCIETIIYGTGYHHRDAYGGDCKEDWPI